MGLLAVLVSLVALPAALLAAPANSIQQKLPVSYYGHTVVRFAIKTDDEARALLSVVEVGGF
eukprot:jgi/Hompol1/4556/HPOL_000112-RA